MIGTSCVLSDEKGLSDELSDEKVVVSAKRDDRFR